jgi:hypothetical protein
MIANICAFLQSMEEDHPLTEDNQKQWCADVKEAWVEQTGESAELLYPVLKLRLAVAAAAAAAAADTGWQWLLTTTQVAQRTADWYDETVNLLTASELGELWKGARTRAALVLSKVPKDAPLTPRAPPKLACTRAETGPMDWGVRYEPVVKGILEARTGQPIIELGRIRHRMLARFAASPDGLFVGEGDMAGCLIEIKCPPTRPITDAIPYGYWCQMQLQMEVCGRPQCMYVEAKFRQGDSAERADGWIAYEVNVNTDESRYVYGSSQPPVPEEHSPWTQVEVYPWELVKLRQVMVARDRSWFQGTAVPAATAFWADVEAARAGTWAPVLPPPRTRKQNPDSLSPRCQILEE